MSIADIIGTGPTRYTFDDGQGFKDSTVQVDVTISEREVHGYELTQLPVERGIDVVDHRRPKPVTLSMSGIVSDAPNGLLDAFANGDTPIVGFRSGLTKSQKAYLRLKEMADSNEPLTIITQRGVFKNMLFADLTFSKNDAGEYIGFDASLQEVRFASTEMVAVSVAPAVQHTAPAAPKVAAPPAPISATEAGSWTTSAVDAAGTSGGIEGAKKAIGGFVGAILK